MMNSAAIKKNLPTLARYVEKRREKKRNRLPKHLLPLAIWPAWLHIAINIAIAMTLLYVMVNEDEFSSEAVPGLAMVVALLLLLYTVPTAIRFKRRYESAKGRILSKINLGLALFAMVLLPICIALSLSSTPN